MEARVERLVRGWTGTADRRIMRHRAVMLCLLILCAATFALGVPRLRIYGHDVFAALDGAWRVLNGQRPAVDFYAVKGPAWYLVMAVGVALAHGNAAGLGYSTALVAAVMSVWSFVILRRRMETMPLLLACIGLVLLAVAPFALGGAPYATVFAMTYNRYGYALAGLVLLECFLPFEDGDHRGGFFGGLSSGIGTALLLSLKISFGLVAVTLVAVSVIARRGERARMAGLAAGFALFAVPLLAYLHFDVFALIRENRIVAAARGSHLGAHILLKSLFSTMYESSLVFVLALLTAALPGVVPRRRAILILVAALTIMADLLLMSTNAQGQELPLVAVVALLLVNEVTVMLRRPDAPAALHAATLLGFGLLVVGTRIGFDAAGMGLALGDKLIRADAGYHLAPPHLAALSFYGVANEEMKNDNGEEFVGYTSEGFDLVRAQSRPGESVRGMGATNPFSYGLLRPPSQGGAVDIDATDLSEQVVPPAAMLLGDVDLIMIPKFPATERQAMEQVLSSYRDLLAEKYVLAAESTHWTLLRKRGNELLESAR